MGKEYFVILLLVAVLSYTAGILTMSAMCAAKSDEYGITDK